MEIFLLILNLSGKMPVVILRLNIWDKGELISIAIDLSNFVLRPSRSTLDLVIQGFNRGYNNSW